MVRRLVGIVAAVSLAWAGSASAQAVDWRNAGGDLFGRLDPEEATVAGDIVGLDVPRLAPLNQSFDLAISAAAERHGLDPKLLHALVIVESGYDPRARSPVGAGGLTQLMPATARELGVRDRFDPYENLVGGADYLARQILRFGDVRLALAAYNAGPGRVARVGRVPDIEETQTYVVRVLDCYLALAAGRAARTARECRAREATQ